MLTEQDLTTAHYSGVLIIFLFFDITQLSSLYNLVLTMPFRSHFQTTYMNESQSFTQDSNPPYILIGTKADLQSERTVSESAISGNELLVVLTFRILVQQQ